MSSDHPSMVIAYHGCEKEEGMQLLLKKKEPRKSNKPYDWLGSGFYCWESNYQRAKEWADSKKNNPFVIGLIVNLGECLNLLDQKYLNEVKKTFLMLKDSHSIVGKELPKNENPSNSPRSLDFVKRYLDKYVIDAVHQLSKENDIVFDTVRAMFPEGGYLYEGAGFQEKNHIQICIRNLDMIKGVFLP